MGSLIYVNYVSRFANNIFQYALAHIVKELVGGELAFSPLCVIKSGERHDEPAEAVPIQEIPLYGITDSRNILEKREWSGKFSEAEKEALRRTGVCFAEDVLAFRNGTVEVSDAYRRNPGVPIVVSGYYQDYRYYRGRREFVRRLLRGLDDVSLGTVPGPDDIVLNFRGTDLSWAQMPLNFHRWILDREEFGTLWIVTEDPEHRTVRGLLADYPSRLLSQGAVEDMKFVMSARRIIMAVSTFCWMAAWLSDARRIYFPVGSPYPLFDRDGDRRLIVDDDERYVYVRSLFENGLLRRTLPFYYQCNFAILPPRP